MISSSRKGGDTTARGNDDALLICSSCWTLEENEERAKRFYVEGRISLAALEGWLDFIWAHARS